MVTKKFSATFGINKGFFHKNEKENGQKIVSEVWQKAAEHVFKEKGLFISAVIKNSNTVYHVDKGCPIGGEKTATVEGLCFDKDIEFWECCVIEVVEIVRKELQQDLVFLEIVEVKNLILLS